jgi:sulfate-transporting ATPase
VGALEVTRLGFRLPCGRQLFDDVSFRVGDGEHAALVGANGVGKSTMLRLVAGEETGATGTIHVDGRLGVMRQMVASADDGRTVRDLLVSLSDPAVRTAAIRLAGAEATVEREPTPGAGIALADAWAAWGDAGGYDAEVLWDVCCTTVLPRGLAEVGDRPASTLSGGEQKRLALEVLLQGDDDVLLLDEPDNFLDVPGKEWLEGALRATPKTVLLVSHDRQLLADATTKVITVEGRGAWTHGASFATWHAARQARLDRLDEEHRRWREERKHIEDQLRELRRRSQVTDAFASRLRATKTKLARHDATRPRSARRSSRCRSAWRAAAPASGP